MSFSKFSRAGKYHSNGISIGKWYYSLKYLWPMFYFYACCYATVICRNEFFKTILNLDLTHICCQKTHLTKKSWLYDLLLNALGNMTYLNLDFSSSNGKNTNRDMMNGKP